MTPIQKQVYDMRDSGARMDQIKRETGLTTDQVNHYLAERRHVLEEHQALIREREAGFELGIEL